MREEKGGGSGVEREKRKDGIWKKKEKVMRAIRNDEVNLPF